MHPIAEIFNYIIGSLLGVYSLLILLRFVFQLVKADYYNPISQGLVKMTAPVLNPMRRVIPGFMGLDIASLILAFIVNTLIIIVALLLSGQISISILPVILIIGAAKVVAAIFNIFIFALLVSIILSWVAPYTQHPAGVLIMQVAEFVLAPFRKIIPPMGGLDISPIFAFLAMGVISRVLAIIGSGIGLPIGSMWMFIIVGV